MNNLVQHTRLLPVLLALGGCATGPDYQRPLLSLPAQWLSSSGPATPAETPKQPALPDWHDYFVDPRLQALITHALEYNYDLRIATERIFEARALHGITQAGKWPEFELLGKREAGLTPGDLNASGRPIASQRYDFGVEWLNYEVDFWGRVKRLDEAALASYLATEEAQRAFRLSLIAEVANAYYQQCEIHERLTLARAIAENRGEVARLSQQRRQAGLMGSMDYLRAAAAAESARNERASLEQAAVAADHELLLLTGQITRTDAAPLPARRPLAEQNLAVLSAHLPAEVLLQRPDVLAAEQKLIAANANIGAARAAFLPRLSLTGVFSTASGGLSNLFDAGSRAWLFKPQLGCCRI
jgi:multidrug efflux system outer membrane protein